MGTLPGWLRIYQHVTNDMERAKFEMAYGVKINSEPGLNNIEMLTQLTKGK